MINLAEHQDETWSEIKTVTSGSYGHHGKRQLDLLVAITIMIVLSPLFFAIAVAIRLTSPGPIFYRQMRIGRNGRPFEMLKFRTMHKGSAHTTHRAYVQNLIVNNISPEDLGEKSLKLKADPRVTSVGRFLRLTGLDEMPQFINVLRGEMSLVGPRPPLPYEFEVYSPWHKQRLSVLPGITGLWQVTAHNLVPFDEMVAIDLDYIGRMSPGLDLKIMAMTPWEMFRGKGSG